MTENQMQNSFLIIKILNCQKQNVQNIFIQILTDQK